MGASQSISADLLVLGGGPAGSSAALALALAGAGASVVVAERSRYEAFRVGETLPPDAIVPITKLGADRVLRDGPHLRSPGTVSAWGSDAAYENDFIFSPYGHGWHLDRRRFDESLSDAAATAGATVIREARALDCERRRNGWQVLLGTSRGRVTVSARWVADATGRSSWLGLRQGASRVSHDRLVGIAGVFACEADDFRTYVETRPTGWWYSAILPDNRGIAVFFTDADLHDLTPLGRRELWNEQLRRSRLTRERVGDALLDFCPRVLPASSTILSQVAGAGWLALGDAACTIDPLSSQGILWALSSGIEAAEAILDAKPDEAAERYAGRLDRRFREYLNTRRTFYSAERRWPDSLFWKRRAGAPGPSAQSTVLGSADIATAGLAELESDVRRRVADRRVLVRQLRDAQGPRVLLRAEHPVLEEPVGPVTRGRRSITD
jgi:flavin-dependent dehydrogenase